MTDEGGEEPVVAPPAERRTHRTLVLAAIAVGALITGLLAFAATRYSSVNSELNELRAVRRVAGDFGATTLTYDYRDLGPFQERMKAHATGTFRRELTEGGLASLEARIKDLKSRSEATVKRIMVSDIDDHSASAVVQVEAKAQNGDAPVQTVDAYIDLQLIKADGRWLIDDVATLDLGGNAPAAGTTTTTAAQPAK